MNPHLVCYIEQNILPQYGAFADGHDRTHIETVLRESLFLARRHGADEDMIYAAAAYHDLGIPQGRREHHLNSAKLFLADVTMKQWFSDAQRTVVAEAIEDHRASAGARPRSLYGCILADADHHIVPEDIVRRIMLYGMANFPEYTAQQQIDRARDHLREKFCEGGYLQFWLNDLHSLQGLADLRALAADDARLVALCNQYL